jgi:hypothetical protein
LTKASGQRIKLAFDCNFYAGLSVGHGRAEARFADGLAQSLQTSTG